MSAGRVGARDHEADRATGGGAPARGVSDATTLLALVAGFCALVCWPLRDAVLSGAVAGAGPDVAVTVWAMWWFGQEWASAAWGGHTLLVNYPDGASGSVLSPITAAMWASLVPLVGEMAAATWTDVLYVGAFAASVAVLARETGLAARWAVFAGGMVLVQRYVLFAVGETSLVGVTGITVSVGLLALLRVERGRGYAGLFAACVALTAVEMPYLVPVLPVAALVRWRVRGARIGLAWGCVGLVLFGLLQAQTQTSGFGLMSAPQRVGFGDAWSWLVVEAPWARSRLEALVWPGPVTWSLHAAASEGAGGRDYLGLTVLALSLVGLGLRPWLWPWMALALAGIALALGSDWFGLPGPFALLNAITLRLVRGLTQPTRYLLLPAIGLSIAAAHGLEALWQRRRALGLAAGFAVLVDGFLFGGLSLRLPTLTLPLPDCVVALRGEGEGGVLVWPWDGLASGEGVVRSRLLQIAHGHPSPGFGVGSWRLHGEAPAEARLKALGWREAAIGGRVIDRRALAALGYRWVLVDTTASAAAFAERSFGRPVATCEGVAIHALP